MKAFRKEHSFHGSLVMIGFGCIAQGVLPLSLRHIEINHRQILIINPDNTDSEIASSYQVPFLLESLTPENFSSVLQAHLKKGDFLLNLSVNVSSVALIHWCQPRGVLYLDTCIEPWLGVKTVDTDWTPLTRRNTLFKEDLDPEVPWQFKNFRLM